MKIAKTPLITAACMGLLTLLPLAVLAAAATENLIVNGNFESADGNGEVPGWKVSGDARYVKLIKENGSQFLRIELPEVTYCGVAQSFDVGSDWAGIYVSAKLRLAHLKKGPENHNTATVIYTFQDAQGQHVGDWSQSMVMQDQDWTEVKGKVDSLPPGAVKLLVQVGFMNAAGTLDIDDIVVGAAK
ncbi:MAG: hypothetical protein ACAI35_17625 [Candidatus Methylacidiphilales bacterium]|nr:hypothetical protein [Candidatus Methylacidiphilales bacterium]